MALSQLFFIIATVFAMSVGQILFKMVSSSIQLTPAGFLGSLLNPKFVAALFVYFFATTMWLLALKATPLRVAYPFSALAFFIVPVLAHYLLDEQLAWNTFVGAALIAAGVWVSIYR